MSSAANLETRAANHPGLYRRSYVADAFRRFMRDQLAFVGMALVLGMSFISIAAFLFAPYDPLKQFSEGLTQLGAPIPPNAQFWLGTDSLGRDMLSRLIWGGRIS